MQRSLFRSLGLFFLIQLGVAGSASFLVAEENTTGNEDSAKGEFKKFAFATSLYYQHYFLKTNSRYEVRGPAGGFVFGAGYVGTDWLFHGGFALLLGPYVRLEDPGVKADFSGTAAQIWAARHLLGPGLRNGYGITTGLGFHYSDIVGRSDVEREDPDTNSRIKGLTMKISNFTAAAGVGLSSFSEGRQRGNEPKLLLTRLEGFALDLLFEMPIKATYNVRYQVESMASEESESSIGSEKRSGRLQGHTLLLRWVGFLGV